MKGIIAGTGVDRILADLEETTVDTDFGQVACYRRGDVVVIPRHGRGHVLAPGAINYKANAMALRVLGCERVIGIHAVGSITSRLAPGDFGLVEDFLDFSGRNLTFCDGTTLPLRHVGMVRCFDRALVTDFVKATYRTGRRDIKAGIVYATTAGPRLETPAEIRAMRNIGCDVVGMTLASEAVLLRELDIPHAAVAYSINWAAGLDEEGVSFLEDESIERLARTILSITLDALEA